MASKVSIDHVVGILTPSGLLYALQNSRKHSGHVFAFIRLTSVRLVREIIQVIVIWLLNPMRVH